MTTNKKPRAGKTPVVPLPDTTPRLIDHHLEAQQAQELEERHPPILASALGAMWDEPKSPAQEVKRKVYTTFQDLAQDVLAALQSQGHAVIGHNAIEGPEGQTILCQQRVKLLRERCELISVEKARLAETYQRVCQQIEQSLQGGEVL